MSKKGLPAKEGYSRYAWEYDEQEKYWDSFEKEYLRPYFEMAKGKKVLDAGSGTGRIALKLKKEGAEVTALDISPEMLDILSNKDSEIETVEGEMEEMPFEDESFDMVFSSMAMVHLKKPDIFMDEAYRVLKDGGLFVLVNIHYRKPLILHDNQGKYTILCYNHFPRHIRECAESLAFGIEEEIIVNEGDDVWVSQILVLRK